MFGMGIYDDKEDYDELEIEEPKRRKRGPMTQEEYEALPWAS